MPTLTVRNLPEEVHRALKLRAAGHGCSTEAEVRAILEGAVKPKMRIRMGEALASLAGGGGLTDAELKVMEGVRDRKPAKPLKIQ